MYINLDIPRLKRENIIGEQLPDNSASKHGKTCRETPEFLQPAFHSFFQQEL